MNWRPDPYCAMKPPSAQRLWPTTKEAASDASHSTASATSSGWPMRRSGRPAATADMSAIFEPSIIGVTTRPGEMALMRMPAGAYSIPAERVSEIPPALGAAENSEERRLGKEGVSQVESWVGT